jgi:RNA polymerase sigma-70 factor (ECF subfamily)
MHESDLASVLRGCLASSQRADWESFMQLAQPVIAAGVLSATSRVGATNRELVDDLVQETFLKMCAEEFRILRNFRMNESNALRAYLKTIATSVVMDYFRSHLAQKKGSGKTIANLDDVSQQLAVSDGQFAEVERRNMLHHVDKCLDGQESRNRALFWLYHRQGMTPKAIASLKGMTVSSDGIESAIYRLTRVVRECLRKAGLLRTPTIREVGKA